MTDKQKENVKRMRKEGRSYSDIASTLDISINTIKSYCRRNDLGANVNTKPKIEKKIYTHCKQCGKTLVKGTKGQPYKCQA